MRVLTLILDGEVHGLDVLRKQLDLAQVTRREFTGRGFFSTLAIPEDAPRLNYLGGAAIGDVQLTSSLLENGAGFVLFLEHGVLDELECYTCGDDSWPDSLGKSDTASRYELSYWDSENRGFGDLASHL
ncbi:MAG: hypothetical protein ACFB0Z_14625 [Candidatus Phaeomarinobacter sp.]